MPTTTTTATTTTEQGQNEDEQGSPDEGSTNTNNGNNENKTNNNENNNNNNNNDNTESRSEDDVIVLDNLAANEGVSGSDVTDSENESFLESAMFIPIVAGAGAVICLLCVVLVVCFATRKSSRPSSNDNVYTADNIGASVALPPQMMPTETTTMQSPTMENPYAAFHGPGGLLEQGNVGIGYDTAPHEAYGDLSLSQRPGIAGSYG